MDFHIHLRLPFFLIDHILPQLKWENAISIRLIVFIVLYLHQGVRSDFHEARFHVLPIQLLSNL